jgi:hypothetical protein
MNGLLRASLGFNALFSSVCAVAALLFAGPLARALAAPIVLVRAVAIALGLFALAVAGIAITRSTPWAKLVIALDFAWVLATPLVLLLHPIETPMLLIAPAFAVATIGLVQLAGLWRVRRFELHRTIFVAASPASAWTILGERFGDIGEWAAPVAASRLDGELGVGARRTCKIAGFGPVAAGQIEERLVEFDRAARQLEYVAITGLPEFIAHASNHWRVRASGHGCEVSTHASVEIRWPMALLAGPMRWKLAGDSQRVLEDLRYRIEQGHPHPRKLALARTSAPADAAEPSAPLP